MGESEKVRNEEVRPSGNTTTWRSEKEVCHACEHRDTEQRRTLDGWTNHETGKDDGLSRAIRDDID